MRKKHISKKFFDLFDRYPRDFYIASFFGFLFLVIIYKVFSYTVLNYDFYKKLALSQQVSETKIDVKRGSIYSNNKGGSLLATGVDLDNLAIDPQVEGDINKLGFFLRDIIFKQICYLKSKNECRDNLTKFIKVLKIDNFSYSESFIKGLIYDKIKKQLSRTKVTSVLISDNLSDDESYDLTRLNLSGVYVNGNNLYVNPEEIFDIDFTIKGITSIISFDKDRLKRLLRKRDLRYIPIYNKISIGVSDDIHLMIENENKAYKKGLLEKKDMISGFIILTPESTRIYPEKELAAQVIGFVDSDMQGHYGLEGYFNNLLRGKVGTTLSLKDTMGRIIDPLLVDNYNAVGGVDIVTTIDRNIQRKIEDIIKEGVKYYQANKGSIIVMDPKTGNILSMANYPSFDPNKPGDVFELERVRLSDYSDPATQLLGIPLLTVDNKKGSEFFYNGKILKLRELKREEIGDFSTLRKIYKYKNDFGAGVYRNNIIQDLYEPGSIFKPLTVAIGLNLNEINRYDLYEDKGFVKIEGSKAIKNVSHKCTGLHTYQHALNYSCNTGMVDIVRKIGKSILSKYLDDFGFGKLTGISLDGEVYGKILPYEKWPRIKLFTTSFGQGISTNMLHMAVAYSVLANGGIYVQPQIVKELRFDDGRVIKNKVEAKYRVIRKDVSETITKMLVDSVQNGVAKNGGVEGFNIAGKTGTSQIAYRGKYEVGAATTVGSFAGYGPAEDPKFVIIVKLDRPRRNQYGGQTSAFLFSQASEFLLDYYGIARDLEITK